MKIGLLTSSRADFGIYYPLAKKIENDNFFDLEIIAFGTHLSSEYGNTIEEIEAFGFNVKHKLYTLPDDDSSRAISQSMGETIKLFSEFWDKKQNHFDIVFALGDRYEMMAAVTSAVPFNIVFGHIHAGETTLGAIDDVFRHSISLMSKYMFVTTDKYKNRAIAISGNESNIFNVGALSIENLMNEHLYSIDEIKGQYNINFKDNTILMTFHPETVDFSKNEIYIEEILLSLSKLISKYQIVITMPNSDTNGLMIRSKIKKFSTEYENIFLFESLGLKGYLSFMKYSKIVLGNSSSAFVESSYFSKPVINLGNRQKGRIITPNILSIDINDKFIMDSVKEIEKLNYEMPSSNIYGDGNTSNQIIKVLKQIVYGKK